MSRLAVLFRRLGPDPRADGALLRAFLRDRDEAAFAEIVRRHGPTVWGICRRQLADPADAEDAFQATFLVLVRRASRLDPAGCVAGWLVRVAVLTSRGLRRRNARRRTVPLPELPARPDPPAVDVDALLLRLPERERAAVVLCHLHGLTQREAADRLGVPEGTLSARLSRGLTRLRRAGPLTGLVVAVPAGVAEAAVTVATAGRAAGPGVGLLVAEVLRMFWLKKLAAAGLAVAAVGGFGIGLGITVRSGPAAVAAEPPAEKKPVDNVHNAELEKLGQEVLEAEYQLTRRLDEAVKAGILVEAATVKRDLLRRQAARITGRPGDQPPGPAAGRPMWGTFQDPSTRIFLGERFYVRLLADGQVEEEVVEDPNLLSSEMVTDKTMPNTRIVTGRACGATRLHYRTADSHWHTLVVLIEPHWRCEAAATAGSRIGQPLTGRKLVSVTDSTGGTSGVRCTIDASDPQRVWVTSDRVAVGRFLVKDDAGTSVTLVARFTPQGAKLPAP